MTGMDHAAAHERIEDLLLEPARLAGLERSTAADDVALREHLAGCPACRADLDGWRRLQHGLAGALPSSADAAAASVAPMELPPSLRASVVSAIRGPEARITPISMRRARSRLRAATWVGLAASIIVLAGTTVITVDQVARRSVAEAEAHGLSIAITAIDRVLAAPVHRVVALRSTSGEGAGSISWSSHDLVVLTTALAKPPGDQRYRCWLEEGDSNVPVGAMYFAGGTAYWVGSLDEWATFQIGPATRFVVTLEAGDAEARTGAAVLSADLGS
jgi:predicted anti-sigma-YlaC factor YlaD